MATAKNIPRRVEILKAYNRAPITPITPITPSKSVQNVWGPQTVQAVPNHLDPYRAYRAHSDLTEQDRKNIEAAKVQLNENGITDDQRRARVPVMSTMLRKLINPRAAYDSMEDTLDVVEDVPSQIVGDDRGRNHGAQIEDAWRLYLGIPQKNRTFGISDYKPSRTSRSSGSTPTPYYFKIERFFERYIRQLIHEAAGYEDGFRDPSQFVKMILLNIEANNGSWVDNQDDAFLNVEGAMGNFTWTRGTDKNGPYIAYYDRWDLTPSIGGDRTMDVGKFVGKPFELYDRLYYDPHTLQPKNLTLK